MHGRGVAALACSRRVSCAVNTGTFKGAVCRCGRPRSGRLSAVWAPRWVERRAKQRLVHHLHVINQLLVDAR